MVTASSSPRNKSLTLVNRLRAASALGASPAWPRRWKLPPRRPGSRSSPRRSVNSAPRPRGARGPGDRDAVARAVRARHRGCLQGGEREATVVADGGLGVGGAAVGGLLRFTFDGVCAARCNPAGASGVLGVFLQADINLSEFWRKWPTKRGQCPNKLVHVPWLLPAGGS